MKSYKHEYDTLFSVIVPVYKQWELVTNLLEELSTQTLSKEKFEVIIVNNDPDTSCPELMCDLYLKVVNCSRPGSYAARNIGVQHSVSKWLVFTDADCRPTKYWLENYMYAINKNINNSFIFAGKIIVSTDNIYRNIYEIYDSIKGIPQHRYVKNGYAATANLCFRRSTFDKVGGFDASRFSGGDADFCRRAVQSGFELKYLEDAIVIHPARRNWEDLKTKSKRIKGGQIASGSLKRRLYYFFKTFLPPILTILRFLFNKNFKLKEKLIAILIQLRLWLVEMAESLRLLFGCSPERR